MSSGVVSSFYWSSTTSSGNTTDAWCAGLDFGFVSNGFKASGYYVWPVRGGQ